MNLSKNFTLVEMIKSAKAQSMGLEAQNQPPEDVINNLTRLCSTVIQPSRDELGIQFNVYSGWRHPELNKAVGGSKTSAHVWGGAADMKNNKRAVPVFVEGAVFKVTGTMSILYTICRRMVNSSLPVDQVIHEYGERGKPSWVHVGIAKEGIKPRREILVAVKGQGYTQIDMKEVIRMVIDSSV